MSGRTWAIFIAAVVILFGGLVLVSGRNSIDVSNVNASVVQEGSELNGNIADHTFGSKDNKVVLIEYGDYQCPGCASAYEPIKALTEKYENQLTFVFRNFPLTASHPNARAAAAAAEVAGMQGKYWEMHSKLYENQNQWSSAAATDRLGFFEAYAREIDLDNTKFSEALENEITRINKKIDYDLALGRKLGVNGTPAFYLGSQKLDQKIENGSPIWSDIEAFEKDIIRPALENAGYDLSEVDKVTS